MSKKKKKQKAIQQLATPPTFEWVRFWSLRVGSLLKTIEPAEYAVSQASHAEPVLTEYASLPPIVFYSDTLRRCKGFPGCLIANGLEMSVFRL